MSGALESGDFGFDALSWTIAVSKYVDAERQIVGLRNQAAGFSHGALSSEGDTVFFDARLRLPTLVSWLQILVAIL
jgi:hypothetical protein